jgi:hypothetical protein
MTVEEYLRTSFEDGDCEYLLRTENHRIEIPLERCSG